MTIVGSGQSRLISDFMREHFHHFNAGALLQAAEALEDHIYRGGRIVLSLAGAMSTARLGTIVSKAIRSECVHAIVCTGANLEEEYFRLVGGDKYVQVRNYRQLGTAEEERLRDEGLNRVTDVAIPETIIESACRDFMEYLTEFHTAPHKPFPHEIFIALASRVHSLQKDGSWLQAANEHNVPIFVPGWEDSSVANAFVAHVEGGKLHENDIRNGIAYFHAYSKWYQSINEPLGLIQVGGGIAGDFASSVAAYATTELRMNNATWAYFCQISDSTTSYGSYSGAPPNEKITWRKLSKNTKRFMIESDATIVLPLLLQYTLDTRIDTSNQEGGSEQ